MRLLLAALLAGLAAPAVTQSAIPNRDIVEGAVLLGLASSGVHFVKDVDKKAFQAAVKPVWDKYGAKYADLVKRINAVQ